MKEISIDIGNTSSVYTTDSAVNCEFFFLTSRPTDLIEYARFTSMLCMPSCRLLSLQLHSFSSYIHSLRALCFQYIYFIFCFVLLHSLILCPLYLSLYIYRSCIWIDYKYSIYRLSEDAFTSNFIVLSLNLFDVVRSILWLLNFALFSVIQLVCLLLSIIMRTHIRGFDIPIGFTLSKAVIMLKSILTFSVNFSIATNVNYWMLHRTPDKGEFIKKILITLSSSHHFEQFCFELNFLILFIVKLYYCILF